MSANLFARIGALISIVAFGAAIWVLHHTLAGVSVARIVAGFNSIPGPAIAGAVALTALSYTVLTGYD